MTRSCVFLSLSADHPMAGGIGWGDRRGDSDEGGPKALRAKGGLPSREVLETATATEGTGECELAHSDEVRRLAPGRSRPMDAQ